MEKTAAAATPSGIPADGLRSGPQLPAALHEERFAAFQYAKPFFSQRSQGLSIEVALPPAAEPVDFSRLRKEVEACLEIVPDYPHPSAEDPMLSMRNVLLTGSADPTLHPELRDAIELIVHVRASRSFPFFHITLLTDTSGFGRPLVENALKLLTIHDEIWIAVNAGTQAYADLLAKGHGRSFPLERTLANALNLGLQRPIVIDTMFPVVNGHEPPSAEIEAYIENLLGLSKSGAAISRVQLYSVRTQAPAGWSHLPLSRLSRIARRVRERTGLRADLY